MKFLKISLAFCLSLAIFFACKKDKTKPAAPPAVTTTGDTTTPIVKTNSATANFYKALIVDYTGHTCGNCPGAAETIDAILSAHKDSVVAIAVHCGSSFAPPILPDYPNDFRTQTGNDWDGTLGMSAAGLPRETINGITYSPYASLPGHFTGVLNSPQTAKMEITSMFYADSAKLKVTVKTTFNVAFGPIVKISAVITEDSIIGAQKDYNPPVGATVINGDERPNYRFDRVLRGSLNGSWGDTLKHTPITVNEVFTNTFGPYKLPAGVDSKKTNLIVFIYEWGTNNVIQVEKLRIR